MKTFRLLFLSALMALSLTACVPAEYDPLGLFQTSGTNSPSYTEEASYHGLPDRKSTRLNSSHAT